MTLTGLAGCASSGASPKDLARELPAPPAYLAPVPLPEPRAGQPVEIVAAENRSAAIQANSRLRDGRAWFDCLRAQYASGKVKPAACRWKSTA